ncbi:helix-turn-helix domain-containing protein [Streptomyces tricolor]|uniref:helix-turn-helix domain-containing protein n=1 Tax=Streptomyces tricolor TaxID=68277 RepID=UPI000A3B8EB2|nr:helix-turn-helix domain-containing protein [Streptomyces tricolor]
MDARVIGRRIAYWRQQRRLTQSDFGALMGGRTTRWVQMLEAGERQADPRLSVLTDSARVLRIPLERLLADDPETAAVDSVELEAIRSVLLRHDVVTGCSDDDGAGPLDVDTLRRRVAHGWDAFQAGAIAGLARLVPDLLIEANRAAARHTGDDQLAAYRALSMVLCLTEATAIKGGSGDLAHLAGHRAVIAAERSGAPVIMATAARHLADAMTHHGQPVAAAEFAVAAAARLTPDLLSAGPEGLSTLGALYLKAAMAQATAADQRDSRRAAAAARAVPDLLDQADDYAEQLGDAGHNRLWSAFGRANIALYRLATHVQLAQGAEGVSVALEMSPADVSSLPRERRAHRLVDLAHAHMLAGQRETAVDALLAAETEAKDEVLRRPRTHQLVQDLSLLGAGSAEGRLRALAGRCGLPE